MSKQWVIVSTIEERVLEQANVCIWSLIIYWPKHIQSDPFYLQYQVWTGTFFDMDI